MAGAGRTKGSTTDRRSLAGTEPTFDFTEAFDAAPVSDNGQDAITEQIREGVLRAPGGATAQTKCLHRPPNGNSKNLKRPLKTCTILHHRAPFSFVSAVVSGYANFFFSQPNGVIGETRTRVVTALEGGTFCPHAPDVHAFGGPNRMPHPRTRGQMQFWLTADMVK